MVGYIPHLQITISTPQLVGNFNMGSLKRYNKVGLRYPSTSTQKRSYFAQPPEDFEILSMNLPGTSKQGQPVDVRFRQPNGERLVSERLPLLLDWKAVVSRQVNPETTPKGRMPTDYLTANGKYYDDCRAFAILPIEKTVEPKYMSRYDGAFMKIEVYASAELFVTRYGKRVCIRGPSVNGLHCYNTGGQTYWPPTPFAPGPYLDYHPNNNVGVRTDDIPIPCPYWSRMVEGFKYPWDGEVPIPRTSRIDKAQCLFLCRE